MHKLLIDLTGKQFGRLIVLERIEGVKPARWYCECECGMIKAVWGQSLRYGQTQSCGCLHRERASAANTTHGRSFTPEERSWNSAKGRCYNKANAAYGRYGGRGIFMCDQWRHDFSAFYSDMGPRPTPKHSLGRIDNDGPYAPNNCRWESAEQQANNKRNNRALTHDGQRLNVNQWARQTGLTRETINMRLHAGLPSERILAPAYQAKTLTMNGESLTINEWSERTGLKRQTIEFRLRKGWSVYEALIRPPMLSKEAALLAGPKRWPKP